MTRHRTARCLFEVRIQWEEEERVLAAEEVPVVL